MLRVFTFVFLALALGASAAPITVREIEFLLRQQTPEAELTGEIRQRRLLAPFDEASLTQLREHGASPAVIALLRQGNLLLTAEEARAFTRHASLPPPAATVPVAPVASVASIAPAPTPPPAAARTLPASSALLDQLAGKLVQLDGDELKPVDVQRLREVRLFAIYNSAMWCGPCRKFTPKLVEHYRQMKAKHPEFEVIFLSGDRDEFNMASYMRTERMPWPAMRFGTQTPLAQLYCSGSIPWLVAVAPNGQPRTRNGVDKKYVAPEEVMAAIDTLLAQSK